MRRTRRQMIKEEFEQDSEEENKKSDSDKNKNFKRAKKSESNKIKEQKKDNLQKETMLDQKTDSIVKDGTKIFSKEFSDLIEKIKMNLNKFNMKPEYSDKPLDEKNEKIWKLLKITKFKLISPIEIYYKLKYEHYHKLSLEDDKCSICQFNFYDDDLKDKNIEEIQKLTESNLNDYEAILLNNCSDHFFHLDCFLNLINEKESAKCPNCNKIYGILTGNQPKGTMKVELDESFSCDDYEDIGTIIIYYNFPNGRGYTGTSRTAFLPNNIEGRKILALLKIAFDRKLTFTVGTSVTTGQENTTIWNGIHHKTNTSGGAQYFGYPDPTYFNRLKQELAAKGVIEDNINEDLESIADSLLPNIEINRNKSQSRKKSRKRKK